MDVLMVLVFHHTERHPQDSAWAKFLSIIHNMSCCELTVGTSNVILIQMIIDGIIDLHLRRQSLISETLLDRELREYQRETRHPQNAVSINQISCAMSAWGVGKRRQQRSWERRWWGSCRRHGMRYPMTKVSNLLPKWQNYPWELWEHSLWRLMWQTQY